MSNKEGNDGFQALIENNSDGILVVNNEGYVKYINPAAEKLFGIQKAEMVGTLFGSPIVAGEYSEITLINILNKVISVEMRVVETEWKGENVKVCSLHDITEFKQMMKDLCHAKEKAERSDQLKSSFLANMSHEIRTPLNAIVGFSGLYHDPDLCQADKDFYAETIQSRADDLLHIIDNILEISLIESGNATVTKQQVFLNEILDSLLSKSMNKLAQKSHSDIRLTCEKALQDDQTNIITDGHIVNTVFFNLIDNAIKFTDSGTIRFGYMKPDLDTVTCYVSDTGIGITAKSIESIFNHFEKGVMENVQKIYSGIGLGLPICKESLALIGGNIWVESVPSGGSTFYFTIPYEQPPANIKVLIKESLPVTFKAAPNWTGKNFLLVEDEWSNMELLKTFLLSSKAELTFVFNGCELRNHFSHLDTFDIVLLDIRLPDASGLDLACEMKAIRPDLPIIAQTAYTDPSYQQRIIEAGCDDYLSKPIDKKIMLSMIDKYISKQ